jgi:peptide deformylase
VHEKTDQLEPKEVFVLLTMKDFVEEENPILHEKAKEVELPLQQEDMDTLHDMLQFLKNSQDPDMAEQYGLRAGVGLAAPQIGVGKRMFAIYLTDDKERLYSYALVNPKITSHSVEMSYLENGEGCLSVNRDVPGIVPRYTRITVKAYDIDKQEEIKLRIRGFPAIAFQHEIDHIDGIMFYDRIDHTNPFTPPEGAQPIH